MCGALGAVPDPKCPFNPKEFVMEDWGNFELKLMAIAEQLEQQHPGTIKLTQEALEKAKLMRWGLSLSFCVRDLALGRMKLENVMGIVTDCRVKYGYELQSVIREYQQSYWRACPLFAQEIAWELYNSNKLWFPRAYGHKHPGLTKGHWVKSVSFDKQALVWSAWN
jgi:hypothetical protein